MAKVLAICIMLFIAVSGCDQYPKVGEIWEHCSYRDDPFKTPKCSKNKILEIKQNYVLYEEIETDWNHPPGKIDSDHVRIFKINSHKIIPKEGKQ